MTETATAEQLVASLTAALDEEEAAAKAASPGPWFSWIEGRDHKGGDSFIQTSGEYDFTINYAVSKYGPEGIAQWQADQDYISRQDPARTLRRVAAHREIVDRYAETLRDYARCLERARGGPIGNADLDDFEAELPVLRSVVEIIAGIYEEPEQ